MSDLIDRQAAINALRDAENHAFNGFYKGLVKAHKIIADLPSAQPERKRGKWIEVDDAYNRISGRCSACGWEAHMYEDDVVGMPFCPSCGAEMRGEQNG